MRRSSLGLVFDVLGFVLVLGGSYLTPGIAWASPWNVHLFQLDSTTYVLLTIGAHLYLAATGLICWLAAAGLKRNKKWGKPVGMATAICMLPGVPLLTLVGACLMYGLWRASPQPGTKAGAPAPPKATADFWESRRKSKPQRIVHTALWVAAYCGQVWFVLYASNKGMPAWHPGVGWWAWFFGLILFNIGIHECGHAAAAMAAGFRFRIISIGPFTFWRGPNGFRFRFDLRLFESGGYMGAVPVADQNLRMKKIFVIAAGPAANALTCLVSLVIFLALPGTSWQSWWGIAMLNITVSSVMAVANLVPLGYCDGSMLWHLIRWTPAGRLLVDRVRVNMLGEQAELCHGRADFDREIELKETMLQRSLASGRTNALMIAISHQSLGTAYTLVDDWPSAEAQFRKSLEFEAEIAAQPALAANAWCGLHRTLVHRYNSSEAGPVYAATVALLESRIKGVHQVDGPAVSFAMLAETHERNGAYQAALDAAGQGLSRLSQSASEIALRAHLLRCKAVCHVQQGELEFGLAAARGASSLHRSPRILSTRRNLAYEDIADLGHALWMAGECTLSISLLQEGIAGLEKGGARLIAAKYRIKLATALRHLGRIPEAWEELPAEDTLSAARRRSFLAERVELHLASQRPDEAVLDARELLDLWRAHSCSPALEIASAGALLAKACLAAEDHLEAEGMALQANDVLAPAQHPDAASCLLTLALAGSGSVGHSREYLIDAAYRHVESAMLLSSAERARRRAEIDARIEHSAIFV